MMSGLQKTWHYLWFFCRYIPLFLVGLSAGGGLIPDHILANVVLYDTASDTGNYAGTGAGVLHMLDIPDLPPASLLSSAVGLPFVGNGQALQEIGVVWQYANVLGDYNQGDYTVFEWRVAAFLNRDDFTIERLLGIDGTPDFWMDIAQPSIGYDQVRSTSEGVNNHYAHVNVSELQWQTINGQAGLAFLVPINWEFSPDVLAGIALSDNSGVTIGTEQPSLMDEGAGLGPQTLDVYGHPWLHAAGRVTAVPESSPSTLLVLVGLTLTVTRTSRFLSRNSGK